MIHEDCDSSVWASDTGGPVCGRYRRLDLQCACVSVINVSNSKVVPAAHWRSSPSLVWAPVCGTYLRCRTLEVQCVVWAPVCGAMSSVPHTGGPVWSGRCQQDHIRAALTALTRNRRARALYCRAPCWNARMLSVRAKVRTTSVCSGTSCCRRPGLASKEQGARATPAHCLLR